MSKHNIIYSVSLWRQLVEYCLRSMVRSQGLLALILRARGPLHNMKPGWAQANSQPHADPGTSPSHSWPLVTYLWSIIGSLCLQCSRFWPAKCSLPEVADNERLIDIRNNSSSYSMYVRTIRPRLGPSTEINILQYYSLLLLDQAKVQRLLTIRSLKINYLLLYIFSCIIIVLNQYL